MGAFIARSSATDRNLVVAVVYPRLARKRSHSARETPYREHPVSRTHSSVVIASPNQASRKRSAFGPHNAEGDDGDDTVRSDCERAPQAIAARNVTIAAAPTRNPRREAAKCMAVPM